MKSSFMLRKQALKVSTCWGGVQMKASGSWLRNLESYTQERRMLNSHNILVKGALSVSQMRKQTQRS